MRWNYSVREKDGHPRDQNLVRITELSKTGLLYSQTLTLWSKLARGLVVRPNYGRAILFIIKLSVALTHLPTLLVTGSRFRACRRLEHLFILFLRWRLAERLRKLSLNRGWRSLLLSMLLQGRDGLIQQSSEVRLSEVQLHLRCWRQKWLMSLRDRLSRNQRSLLLTGEMRVNMGRFVVLLLLMWCRSELVGTRQLRRRSLVGHRRPLLVSHLRMALCQLVWGSILELWVKHI